MPTLQYRGADLHCYYQRQIDWNQVNATELMFFIVQISRGSAPLTRAVDGVTYTPESQVDGVRSIARMLGGYHFCLAHDKSPERQAATFSAELHRWGALDFPPFFDVETSGEFVIEDPQTGMFCQRFAREMRRQGFRHVGIYSNAYALSKLGMERWEIPGLLVWAADYGTLNDPTKPVPDLRYYTGPHDIRQYSSKGTISGIGPGYVDLNQTDLGFLRFTAA